jgi:hypothetical protein
MRRRTGILLLLAAAAFPLAAAQPPAEPPADPIAPPDDFQLELAVAPRPGGPDSVETIALDAAGLVRCSARRTAEGELPAVELRIPPAAVAAIHAELVARRFFELAPVYSDPDVADGDLATLGVVAGGRSHRVTTVNVAVEAFDAVVLVLFDALPVERRIAYNALHAEGVKRVER